MVLRRVVVTRSCPQGWGTLNILLQPWGRVLLRRLNNPQSLKGWGFFFMSRGNGGLGQLDGALPVRSSLGCVLQDRAKPVGRISPRRTYARCRLTPHRAQVHCLGRHVDRENFLQSRVLEERKCGRASNLRRRLTWASYKAHAARSAAVLIHRHLAGT